MTKDELIKQAAIDSTELGQAMFDMMENYIKTSNLPHNQKIVVAGRALNALHVFWIGNLGRQVEDLNKKLSDG